MSKEPTPIKCECGAHLSTDFTQCPDCDRPVPRIHGKPVEFSISMMGVKFPIDKEIQEKINWAIYNMVQQVIQKENFHKAVAELLLRNPEYAKKIFKPIIEEIVHNLDFKATLDID